MNKLLPHLKPFIVGLLLCFVLLFGQAMADLNLPSFMSDIVNVGIQQGGVEHATPEKITKDGFTFITTFMSAEEKELVKKSYKQEGEVYTLKSDENIEQLDKFFSDSIFTFLNVVNSLESSLPKSFSKEQMNTLTFSMDATTKTKFANAFTEKDGKFVLADAKNLDTAKRLFSESKERINAVITTLDSTKSYDEIPAFVFAYLQTVLNEKDFNTLTSSYKFSPEKSTYTLTAGKEDAKKIIDSGKEKLSAMITEFKNNTKKPDKSAASSPANINLKTIYKSQKMFDLIPQMNIDEAHKQTEKVDDMLVNQAGISFCKLFLKDAGVDTDKMQSDYIVRIGLMMLLVAFLGGIASVIVSLLSSRIAAGVARNMRNKLFEKVSTFSNEQFDKFSTASLITRSTNDITQIQMFLMIGIRMICYAPIMAVGGVIIALDKSASMIWIIAAASIFILGVITVIFSFSIPKFKSVQKLVDKLNLVAREGLTGLMVIRAFGTEKHETGRFDEVNTDLTKTQLFINRIMNFMFPIMMLTLNCITLIVIWVGSHQVAEANMQIGDMIAFMQYAIMVFFSFIMMSAVFIFAPRAAVSAVRIAEVLDCDPTIIEAKNTKLFDNNRTGYVEFKNVDFRYKGASEDALHNISFVAEPGKTTAFIGSTGSGKTTIANLIMRFYDITGGQILINGTDIKDLSLHDLRDTIGYVPQKGVLLSGSIKSNLKYGKPSATDKEIKEVASVAQSLDFILEKENGFDSEISQGGANVSGGQKQRLSIARALTKKSPIYLFDDSFSALDFKTDKALRAELQTFVKDSALLIVAQRVSTIMNADQIVVLDQGEIVGIGTHKELLKSCPEYLEIASSQLSKEEL